MFQKRYIKSDINWLDKDGLKIYTISVNSEPVDQKIFINRLEYIKSQKEVDWRNSPGFVIFHNGAKYLYLILGWWGNDNELFTSVSVKKQNRWEEDSTKYSFCVYDLEVFWSERNIFIQAMYCEEPDITLYRNLRYPL